MPAPSLFHLALATAIRFVKDMDDLGAMPYMLARPILQNVHNPEKLHALEVASPHFTKEDGELWLEFIKRDIPDWESYQLPEKTDNWYGVYCDLCDQVQRALDADAEKMKIAIEGISAKRALLTPKIIPESRSSRMAGARPSAKQRQASFARRMGGIKAPYEPSRSEPTPRKKLNIFHPPKINPALTMPTKSLNNRASQIKRAPIGLIEEHQHRRPNPAEKPAPLPPKTQALPHASADSQHPMLAQVGPRPRPPISRTTIVSRTVSSVSGSGDAPGAKKPADVAIKPGVKSGVNSQPIPPRDAAKASSSSLPAPPTSSEPSSRPPSSGPPPPRQGIIRRRPAPSIFMPAKRRRVS
ncbi:RNA polymerase II transcription factor SIII subunit A [Penicillium paradoxum]|uniref:RNA polymerase II transcription factor SIII subunit A n=1 Tax=Penicillium paradoxum TaxID=176176 RepID=UPI002548B10F|nr:RNA polymerase II transcription factor SIII subunit A [Penicillium paradoxum]KAJ5788173.1 RNA polymerase II transcription factor SIII subunit A [Penicillium paradoxum]